MRNTAQPGSIWYRSVGALHALAASRQYASGVGVQFYFRHCADFGGTVRRRIIVPAVEQRVTIRSVNNVASVPFLSAIRHESVRVCCYPVLVGLFILFSAKLS